ncbi:hypothetical protein ALC62_15990 [Cyphomyrmex costatus]|uniref:Uncharacterized protein n=1 Tax=Cyphomyrmex costatus TaxID=456900 RepID=A0A151I6C7_9HYME|nr:hypothetical protein ALC62_15990 [Cyphomyrmex costatus]
MVPSPACECGDPRQDLNHTVFFCPFTRRRARPLVLYLNKTFPSHSYNIFTLLVNPSHKFCRLLLAFAKSFDVPILTSRAGVGVGESLFLSLSPIPLGISPPVSFCA